MLDLTASIPSLVIVCVFVVGALGCRMSASSAPAPVASDSGAYVLRLGNDTVAAESYVRSADRLEGIVVRRVPRTAILRYVVTLDPSGMPSQLEYNTRLADGNMLPNGARSITVTFTGDSAITQIWRDTAVTRRVAVRNAFPAFDDVMSLYALPIAALMKANHDSAAYRSYAAGTPQSSAMPVVRKGLNRYWLYSEGNPIEVLTDARGRVLTVDGSRTTTRINTQRQATLDVPALAVAFAQRERVVGAMASLSPRDSVSGTIGGARLWVDYGRPAKRGRTIFGPTGVLGDTLWRTGANASTKFRTDAPLSFGGQVLPPGTYSVMTLAVPGRYQLIFSEFSREVLRVPLQATELSPPLERFTIVIEPTGENAAAIRLRWDTMQLSAPFTAGSPP